MKNIMKKNEYVKMTQEEKVVVADLFKKVNAELTPEKLAELSGDTASREDEVFVDYHEKVDELKLPTEGVSWLNGRTAGQLRAALHRLVDLTHKVGGKVVCVGRRIVRWFLSMLERFPMSMGAIVLVVLISVALNAIPWVGGVLSCLFQIPALYAVGVLVLAEVSSNLLTSMKKAS